MTNALAKRVAEYSWERNDERMDCLRNHRRYLFVCGNLGLLE